MGPFTDGLHSGAKYEASAVYEHKAYMTARGPKADLTRRRNPSGDAW